MRILQVTNIISHHQLPLAREISNIVGADNFRFAVTTPPDHERQRLGWNNQEKEPWIIRAGECEKEQNILEHWWDTADVVICGERRFSRMQDRLDTGKLTFYMSERWWKPPIGMARLLHPRFALMASRFARIAKSPLFNYLPMGTTAADDMSRIAAFKCCTWQWGYFTELPNPLPLCERNGGSLRILWAGRMLKWKRVDTLIRAFSQLQKERKDTALTLVGEGPERCKLEQLAKKWLAEDSFQFLPPVPATQVIELMKHHHIYVLPSNGYEGWGAVINEAMSTGCAVIASEVAGAAKTMIRHGDNGLLFKPGDWKSLAAHLVLLSRDDTRRRQISEQGQYTMIDEWSPAIAAKRFLAVSAALLTGHSVPKFVTGPMAQLRN